MNITPDISIDNDTVSLNDFVEFQRIMNDFNEEENDPEFNTSPYFDNVNNREIYIKTKQANAVSIKNQSNANIMIKMNKKKKVCPRCTDSPGGGGSGEGIGVGRIGSGGYGNVGSSGIHANKEYSWFTMILAMWTIMLFPLSLFGSIATAFMTAAFADFVCAEFDEIRNKVKYARIIIFACNIVYYYYMIILLVSLFLAGEKVEPFTGIVNRTCKAVNSIWIGNKTYCLVK